MHFPMQANDAMGPNGARCKELDRAARALDVSLSRAWVIMVLVSVVVQVSVMVIKSCVVDM